jgi:hypothetical protein
MAISSDLFHGWVAIRVEEPSMASHCSKPLGSPRIPVMTFGRLLNYGIYFSIENEFFLLNISALMDSTSCFPLILADTHFQGLAQVITFS